MTKKYTNQVPVSFYVVMCSWLPLQSNLQSVRVCLCLVVYLHVHNINVHIRLPLVPCQFTRSLFLLTVLSSMAEIPIWLTSEEIIQY